MHLARFPRRRYTEGPTPLQPLPHLTERLGGPSLYVKRDDLLGLAGGGNKTRKLEFVVAEAIEEGADTLITCGSVQSNHCRLTLAAAIREGLRCQLVLEERVPDSYDPEASGNNFLYGLLGVERIEVVPGGTDLVAAMAGLADELAERGRKAHVIPGGASTPLGALGYVSCAEEILAQTFEAGLRIDHVVCASGSGGTHSGLLVGLLGNSAGIPVTGISVRHPRKKQEESILELARETAEFLGIPGEIPEGAVTVRDEYVGPGYSLPTDEMVEAVRLLARVEGLLLDPVYTGKAMAGLLDLAREGRFDPNDNVLFLHTGGAPSLFAYRAELAG
ncbi:MAG TPA: D-cysteine desulfhydrase [Longimicrobiales bacterium]|nr:D-cysteine desulfhydrase [Longimicrobiales bacterium]